MYKLNYIKGIVDSIQNGDISFGINPDNTDFIAFLDWNAQQAVPLDLNSTIPIPEPTYVELRENEYPPIQEQLDMIYWDKINNTTLWTDKITEIKEKYPK